MSEPILEAAAQKIADATSKPPFLYELGVEGARKVLDDIQAAPVEKLDVGASEGLDASRLAVAGDSVGGNMSAALTILAKRRGDVAFVHQSLYYPVTDGAQDTASYREYADGPSLTAKGMAWFWDAYTPDPGQRAEITASPLRATLEELAGLSPAFVVVDENDVLRDEGEAYARRLTQAGVPTTSVRYNGTLHDFMMLNPVRESSAASAAIAQAISVLRGALGTGWAGMNSIPGRSSRCRFDRRDVLRLGGIGALLGASSWLTGCGETASAGSEPESSSGKKDMSTQTVTVLLVHGAFAESASWNPVISQLRAQSVDVVAVANPLRSVSGDAAYLRNVITGTGTPVVLVGHSYGGMMITEAGAGNDGVVGLVYVAAFALEQGESALELSSKFPGSTLGAALVTSPVPAGGNEFRIRPEAFHQQFVADGSATEAELMAVTQRPVTEAALVEGLPTDAPAWKHRPSWFVFGDQDRNIPVEALRFMAERGVEGHPRGRWRIARHQHQRTGPGDRGDPRRSRGSPVKGAARPGPRPLTCRTESRAA